MKKYRQRFTVSGSGQFPFDMLRYDQCFPEHETQSRLLGPDYAGEPRTVEMMRFVESKNDIPTIGRWRSFCWDVVQLSITTEKI